MVLFTAPFIIIDNVLALNQTGITADTAINAKRETHDLTQGNQQTPK